MATFNLNEATLPFYIADVSTAGQIYIPVPTGYEGQVVEIRTALNGAITGADAGLTFKINGTAITGGTITIANASSAAGDADSCNPTGANYVKAGDVLEAETDGASTNAVAVSGVYVIRR